MKTFLKILFAPLLWLVNACSPLGNPVDEEKSNNHYYNKKKTDIQFSRMGNWFELGNSPMNADVESFEVLTNLISKDKNRAYFMDDPIEPNLIDMNNFYIKEGPMMTNIGFNKKHVFIFEKAYGVKAKSPEIITIENANPTTYVRTEWDWASDDKNHFYRNQLIRADFDSFENINRTFSKDQQYVYVHYNKHFEIIDADVSNFKVLDEGYFAMDDLHVFSMTYTEDIEKGTKLVSIPKTAGEEVLLLNTVYLKIGSRIFYRGTHLADLNSEHIEIIKEYYIKDDHQVYYQNKKLTDVDPTTFGKKGKWDIGDKDGLFREGVRVK